MRFGPSSRFSASSVPSELLPDAKSELQFAVEEITHQIQSHIWSVAEQKRVSDQQIDEHMQYIEKHRNSSAAVVEEPNVTTEYLQRKNALIFAISRDDSVRAWLEPLIQQRSALRRKLKLISCKKDIPHEN